MNFGSLARRQMRVVSPTSPVSGTTAPLTPSPTLAADTAGSQEDSSLPTFSEAPSPSEPSPSLPVPTPAVRALSGSTVLPSTDRSLDLDCDATNGLSLPASTEEEPGTFRVAGVWYPSLPQSCFGPLEVAPLAGESSSAASDAAVALKQDMLSFHMRQDDALADLLIQLADGQAVLANSAIVEARLPALLSQTELLGEADPALFNVEGDRGRKSAKVQQVRVHGLSRATLDALLSWAYGEVVPSVAQAFGKRRRSEHVLGNRSSMAASDLSDMAAVTTSYPSNFTQRRSSPTCSLQDIFDVLEATNRFEQERLGALLRAALLEALDVDHFAAVLRESHVRHISGLKQGCMRFALHHFDELIEHPEVFVSPLQELPEVVSDLFRLSRRWKDEVSMEEGGRRASSPRPAPAPPSTFVSDLGRLYNAARLEEERGAGEDADGNDINDEAMDGRNLTRSERQRRDLAADCRLRVGEEVFLAHSSVLAARSEFFSAAFSSEMSEGSTRTVTLQHVQGEMPSRESVLALLYFIYTGKTSKVRSSIAMEILALVGGDTDCDTEILDDGPTACSSGPIGYLQLHDATALRSACEDAAECHCLGDATAFLDLLIQADSLGLPRLKRRALHLTIHHFKDLALTGKFAALPPLLLNEVLKAFAHEFDPILPSAATGQRWKLGLQPVPDTQLKNTFEALINTDLSLGAGAMGTPGCSEASLTAAFDRPVRVRRLRIGVDLTIGDFDGSRLNGTRLQYLGQSGKWLDTGVVIMIEHDIMLRDINLPQVFTSKAFRLVRRQRLALGYLAFE